MGLRLNVGSLIRTVKIEIVNHYVTTKPGTSETIFAHSYSLKSLSPLPFSLGETLRFTSWNEKDEIGKS